MEHSVLRGRRDHPVEVGDAVLVGPHSHLNGTVVEDEVFVATGVAMFPRLARGHRVGATLPSSFPDRHDELWAVQAGLDFPGTRVGRTARHPDARGHPPDVGDVPGLRPRALVRRGRRTWR
jgi:hypothetical protein